MQACSSSGCVHKFTKEFRDHKYGTALLSSAESQHQGCRGQNAMLGCNMFRTPADSPALLSTLPLVPTRRGVERAASATAPVRL
eukprot:scaffold24442_cov75-Phaeocystis_antarctica.AAC.1